MEKRMFFVVNTLEQDLSRMQIENSFSYDNTEEVLNIGISQCAKKKCELNIRKEMVNFYSVLNMFDK